MQHPPVNHPHLSRRAAVQIGSVGLLGLGMNHVTGLRALAETGSKAPRSRAKAVIYIFLSATGSARQL